MQTKLPRRLGFVEKHRNVGIANLTRFEIVNDETVASVEAVAIIGAAADAVGTGPLMTEEGSGVVRAEAHPLRDEIVTHIRATAIVTCRKGVVEDEKTTDGGAPRPVQSL